jgi:hypothetical protein
MIKKYENINGCACSPLPTNTHIHIIVEKVKHHLSFTSTLQISNPLTKKKNLPCGFLAILESSLIAPQPKTKQLSKWCCTNK